MSRTNLGAVEPLQAWVVDERLGTALLELGPHRLIHVATCCHEYRSGQKDEQQTQLSHLEDCFFSTHACNGELVVRHPAGQTESVSVTQAWPTKACISMRAECSTEAGFRTEVRAYTSDAVHGAAMPPQAGLLHSNDGKAQTHPCTDGRNNSFCFGADVFFPMPEGDSDNGEGRSAKRGPLNSIGTVM